MRRWQPTSGQRWSKLLVCAVLGLCLLTASPEIFGQGGSSRNEHWVGSWATAVIARAPQGQAQPAGRGQPPQGQPAQAPQPPLNFNNQTLRQIARASLGGERVRVVFTNVFGTA